MPGGTIARRREITESRPGPRVLALACEPGAQVAQGLGRLRPISAACVPFHEGGGGLSECAGMYPMGHGFDPAPVVELHRNFDAASAGWRANLCMTVLPLEIARFRQRRGEPQDICGVEGRVHWACVTPDAT